MKTPPAEYRCRVVALTDDGLATSETAGYPAWAVAVPIKQSPLQV